MEIAFVLVWIAISAGLRRALKKIFAGNDRKYIKFILVIIAINATAVIYTILGEYNNAPSNWGQGLGAGIALLYVLFLSGVSILTCIIYLVLFKVKKIRANFDESWVLPVVFVMQIAFSIIMFVATSPSGWLI
jgi:hypothetical protein